MVNREPHSTNDATGKARVLAVLRRHAVVSSWTLTMESRVLNTTGRISDLRDDGFDIRAERVTVEGKPVWLYRLVDKPVQLVANL